MSIADRWTGAPSGAAVRFEHVQKSYDGRSMVVADLNLDIAPGEFLTLLGPSGSGKTTSLMMLAGFEAPSAGHILVDDTRIETVPPHRRNIGMVFQNYALFPHMSVAENLAYGLEVRRWPRAQIDEAVRAALDLVQMRTLAARRPSQLSGGQQQRVALARALIFEPTVVLMDEPLGALDKNLREHLQLEIKRLHDRLGITVLYVTHDQSEALTMSDRVAVFNEGRIEQIAPPKDIYERPATRFVAEFIGETNLLQGRLDRSGSGPALVLPGETRIALDPEGAVGERACMSLRPELIRIGGAAEGLPNRLTLPVSEVIYHGDYLRIGLELPDGTPLVCKLRNQGGQLPVKVGERMPVGWAAEAGILFDA